jgi:hypothetical protein
MTQDLILTAIGIFVAIFEWERPLKDQRREAAMPEWSSEHCADSLAEWARPV